MKKHVILKPLIHHGRECISIYFEHDPTINNLIRKQAGAKWSNTQKAWWIPMSKEHYNKLFFALKGRAELEYSALHDYLSERKRKNIPAQQINNLPAKSINKVPEKIRQEEVIIAKSKKIDPVNAHILPAMKQKLKLKAYSASTIKTYLNEMSQLLQTIKNIPADELTPEHLSRYFVYCFEKLRLTENTLHSRINALKFYYEQVLGREKFFWEIPRPKKHLQLPKVLNKEEIASLIRSIQNIKHKTMIMLGYSCGLRVSEIIGLKVADLDENRRMLFVRKAKGKKDRVISLSPAMLVMLREYLNKYEPKNYFFEGQQPESAYSVRSLESIIHAAKQKAGIKKDGSMHMLRHSFATHLLDKGTDVVFIQKLLGHNDIKTTLRYLHVTNKDILNILSPIEDIKDMIG